MSSTRLALAGLALVAGIGLSACDDGYGYSGVSVGYNSWDPYYGGFSADPYWGWYGDYYYPGTGIYIYDRSNHRHRWNDAQRGYWQGRSQGWRGREMRPMWRDYGGNRGNRGDRGHHRH